MDVQIHKEQLEQAIRVTRPGVGTRSTLPILNYFLLTAQGADGLEVRANNLETETACIAPVKNMFGFEQVAVPAKLFGDLIASLPAGAVVSLSNREGALHVEADGFEANVKTADARDFPISDLAEAEYGFTVDPFAFRAAIKRVTYAAASDESRPILQGVQLMTGDNQLILTAVDGFRLAQTSLPVDAPNTGIEAEAVIPARTMNIVASSIPDNLPVGTVVKIRFEANRVVFVCDNVTVSAAIIAGQFPDHKAIIPTDHALRVVVDLDELRRIVQPARLFSTYAANRIRLDIRRIDDVAHHVLTMTGQDERGNCVAEIDISDIEASEDFQHIDMLFNGVYFADCLNALNGQEKWVTLQLNGAASPVVIRQPGESGLHLIMSMSPSKS